MPRKLSVVISLMIFAAVAVGFSAARKDAGDGSAEFDASVLADISSGPKPTAYLRTNQVVYLPGQSIQLLLDMSPNGHLFSKTFFLYLQNMSTGEMRFVNLGGLQPAGQITDLVGNPATQAQTFAIPTTQNLVLLGQNGHISGAIQATQALVGNHRFVLELRDITGRRIFQRITADFAVVTEVTALPAEINADTTLTSDKAYLLENRATFVRSGATLTIQPGTYILGAGIGALIVDRGAKINASGTAARPIVLTSAQPVGTRKPQDWGGLIINGRAPVNIPGGEGEGEGDTGKFGGNDPEDSSGVLRYVRVEYAGIEFSPENELNGIAFQGVGRGTLVEYIQVHRNKDDGVEFFGGTVNVKYVLLTGNADDSMDWTEGWIGKAQFVVIQQDKRDADQGIEADNNADNNELEPRSSPTIYNLTLIGGKPAEGSTEESDIGMLLREGTRAFIHNAVVTGFGQQAIVIDHNSTVNQAQGGNLNVSHSLFFGNATRQPSRGTFGLGSNATGLDVPAFFNQAGRLNRASLDPRLRDAFNLLTPDFRPQLESPVLDVNFVRHPPDDGFFTTPIHFIGGVDPWHDWTAGWSTHSPN